MGGVGWAGVSGVTYEISKDDYKDEFQAIPRTQKQL